MRTRGETAAGKRTIVIQSAIVTLVVLAYGVLLPGYGATQVVIAGADLALIALLVAALGRNGEEGALRRCAESAGEEECVRLLAQNTSLRRELDDSQLRSVEINDMVLRRVGVELHDGPAQLISLALLRLDCLRPEGAIRSDGTAQEEFQRIRGALQEALAEIRSMAAGLTLPELSDVPVGDVLRLAVRNHERRTATAVACDVEALPQHVPAAIKSCLYRFAQEALNNAYRHADGRGQALCGWYRADTIEVEVADAGPGFEPDAGTGAGRLGLLGMRERVASLGGTLEIDSRPGSGTRLTTRFKMAG